ncbi:MAG TPA: response regulator [Gemmatimonadaceae bacterium]|nr:response regulator [Gemmatimonadaceae bacterium]
MSKPANAILLVDPDARTRALLTEQLKPLGCSIFEAADGPTALSIIGAHDVKLVVTELYLQTNTENCLINAIRRDKALTKTRTLAHTHRSTAADRDWAMQAGADAYLIKPTRAERMRYVVGRLTTTRTSSRAAKSATPERPESPYRR